MTIKTLHGETVEVLPVITTKDDRTIVFKVKGRRGGYIVGLQFDADQAQALSDAIWAAKVEASR